MHRLVSIKLKINSESKLQRNNYQNQMTEPNDRHHRLKTNKIKVMTPAR